MFLCPRIALFYITFPLDSKKYPSKYFSFEKLSLMRLHSILLQWEKRVVGEKKEKSKKEVHNHNLLNCLSYFRARKK